MHITGHTKETTFLKYVGKTQSRDSYADAFMEKARFILQDQEDPNLDKSFYFPIPLFSLK